MKGLGSRFKQQSVMSVNKNQGKLMYTGGEDKGKEQNIGQIHYNQKMKIGSGDTQMKGRNSTFTVNE